MSNDVEARVLVYVVVLGAFFGLAALTRRRAFHLRFHMTVLAALLGAGAAALIEPDLLSHVAVPLASAFAALVLAPSLALMSGRALAGRRRYGPAATLVRAGALPVGNPAVLRNEARFYRSLEAAESGDADVCRAELALLAAAGAIPVGAGGGALEVVLPLAVERRWRDVLAALDDAASSNAPVLRSFEARGAAECGDFPRAVSACAALESHPGGRAAYAQAGRAVLAVAGRKQFLEEARERQLPVAAADEGRVELALARACEASGDTEEALRRYARAMQRGHGVVVREARDGIERCRRGAARVPALDDDARAALDGLEARLAAERPAPPPLPWWRAWAATLALTAFTVVVSLVAFAVFESSTRGYLAAGALSAQLVREGGEWWRLGSYALLHGGWLHLVLNAASILIVGVALERRVGAARTAIVYLVAAFLAAPASVWINDTPVGVGASGGALGLMGALLVVVVRRGDLFTPAQRASWSRVLWLSVAATAALGALEYEVVDNAAHGAGIVVGALLGLLFVRDPDLEPRAAAPARAFAACLVALLLVSFGAAAAQARSWYEWQAVAADGVEVELPAWMHASADGKGVWWQPPVEFVVQLGVAPDEPDPAALVRLVEPGEPQRAYRHAVAGLPAGEEQHVFDPHPLYRQGDGMRVHVIRRGDAFAVALLPDVAEARDVFAPALERLRDSLAAGDGAR